MESKCKDNNGYMLPVDEHIIQEFRNLGMEFGDLATRWKKSEFESLHNLTKDCLEQNTVDLSQFEGNGYDEVVAYVRTTYATLSSVEGLHCDWALLWHSNEPNGGADEQCVMMSNRGNGYKYMDVPCNDIGTRAGFVCNLNMESV